MNEAMIGACGLDCTECGAYLAWKGGNSTLREKTAVEWKAAFGIDVQASDIDCAGCQGNEGPKIDNCFECGFRACAASKNIRYCIQCISYLCIDLADFFMKNPEAQAHLENRGEAGKEGKKAIKIDTGKEGTT